MSNKQILIENNNNLINIESIVEQLPQENVWSNDTTRLCWFSRNRNLFCSK